LVLFMGNENKSQRGKQPNQNHHATHLCVLSQSVLLFIIPAMSVCLRHTHSAHTGTHWHTTRWRERTKKIDDSTHTHTREVWFVWNRESDATSKQFFLFFKGGKLNYKNKRKKLSGLEITRRDFFDLVGNCCRQFRVVQEPGCYWVAWPNTISASYGERQELFRLLSTGRNRCARISRHARHFAPKGKKKKFKIKKSKCEKSQRESLLIWRGVIKKNKNQIVPFGGSQQKTIQTLSIRVPFRFTMTYSLPVGFAAQPSGSHCIRVVFYYPGCS
jgi:hypothetical protein